MPGASPGPPRHSHFPPDKALLSAGLVMLALVLAHEVTSSHLRVMNFADPMTVEAIVLDSHIRREGGGQTCQPIFRYEVNGEPWTTQLPTANPQSCYTDGYTVPLTVDAANPHRIADRASERYAQQGRYGSLAMVSAMLGIGGWLRWRKLGLPYQVWRCRR